MNESDITIIYSPRRKRITFSVSPEGEKRMLAPTGTSRELLLSLALANPQIWERLSARVARNAPPPKPTFTEGEEFYLWGKKYPIRFGRGNRTAFDGEAIILPAGDSAAVFAALESFYRKAIESYVEKRVHVYATLVGARIRCVRITGARTIWGSCNNIGVIRFSWMLAQCPPPLIDYVIWHELTHLEERGHSPRFWFKLEAHLPDARKLDRQLDKFGKQCPDFPESHRD